MDRITEEPGKMDGQACVRGFRFTVSHLVRLVAAGRTLKEIQADFPFIEAEDVEQSLLYAARAIESTSLL